MVSYETRGAERREVTGLPDVTTGFFSRRDIVFFDKAVIII